MLGRRLLGLLVNYSGRGTYSQATPGHVQLHVSKQKIDYSFLHLLGLEDQFSATEDAVVHLDTFCPFTSASLLEMMFYRNSFP